MKNTLIDLSGKISETAVSILVKIEKAAIKLDLSFFIVGATARDIIFEHQFDIKPSRATIDIDIGVIVSGWDQFELLKDELLSLREFSPSKQKQRLLYEDNFPVDIIPFGTIATEDGSITWPPDHENRMSIVGFQECYQHAISVKLSSIPELVVKVVSLAGLALLKLISWDDNPVRRNKDAPDLFLGRDIGIISTAVTKTKLIDILKRKANSKQGHKIAMDILQSDISRRDSYDRIVECFDALLKGLAEEKG